MSDEVHRVSKGGKVRHSVPGLIINWGIVEVGRRQWHEDKAEERRRNKGNERAQARRSEVIKYIQHE